MAEKATLQEVEGIQIVRLPEKARNIRVPVEIDPKLKKLVDGIEDLRANGLMLKGTATEEDIQYFLKGCLAVQKPEEMTNHQLFMLGFVSVVDPKDLQPAKVEGNTIVGGLTGRVLLERFKATKDGKRVLDCFVYDQNWKPFETFDPKELEKFRFKLHFYQEWMGTWQKNHNLRTWLRFLDSFQGVSKTAKGGYRFTLARAWGSVAFLKVLGQVYQGKVSYRDALIAKARELGLLR